MTISECAFVWVFCGENARFPSGVFMDLAVARTWIEENGLSGLLTRYPVGVGVFDWAVQNGHFEPRSRKHSTAVFKQRFTTAALEHFHFEDGVMT